MEEKVSDDEIRSVESYIGKCVNEKLGANYKTKAVQSLSEKVFKQIFQSVWI